MTVPTKQSEKLERKKNSMSVLWRMKDFSRRWSRSLTSLPKIWTLIKSKQIG